MTDDNFRDNFDNDAHDDLTDQALRQNLPPTPSSPGKSPAYLAPQEEEASTPLVAEYDYSPHVGSFPVQNLGQDTADGSDSPDVEEEETQTTVLPSRQGNQEPEDSKTVVIPIGTQKPPQEDSETVVIPVGTQKPPQDYADEPLTTVFAAYDDLAAQPERPAAATAKQLEKQADAPIKETPLKESTGERKREVDTHGYPRVSTKELAQAYEAADYEPKTSVNSAVNSPYSPENYSAWEDVSESYFAKSSTPDYSMPPVGNSTGLPEADPYVITPAVMANLKQKADRYRPLLIGVENSLSDSVSSRAKPTRIPPKQDVESAFAGVDIATVFPSSAQDFTKHRRKDGDKAPLVPPMVDPITFPQRQTKNRAMKPAMVFLFSATIALAIIVVILDAFYPVEYYYFFSLLGLADASEVSNAAISIYAYTVLFPLPPIPSDQGMLLIFVFPGLMIISLPLSRYVVLNLGARNIFMLSSLVYALLGYVISQVSSYTLLVYLFGVRGTVGALILVSCIYLLRSTINQPKSLLRSLYSFISAASVALFALPFLLNVEWFSTWILPLGGSIIIAIAFFIVFNIQDSYFVSPPAAIPRDIIGSLALTASSIGFGWAICASNIILISNQTKWLGYIAGGFFGLLGIIYEALSARGVGEVWIYNISRDRIYKFLTFIILGLVFALLASAVFLANLSFISHESGSYVPIIGRSVLTIVGMIIGVILLKFLADKIGYGRIIIAGCISITLALFLIFMPNNDTELLLGASVALCLVGLGVVMVVYGTTVLTSGVAVIPVVWRYYAMFTGAFLGGIFTIVKLTTMRPEILFNSTQSSIPVPHSTTTGFGARKVITADVMSKYHTWFAIHSTAGPFLIVAIIALIISSIGFVSPRANNIAVDQLSKDAAPEIIPS